MVGLGKTGMSLISFLLRQGAEVLVSDFHQLTEVEKLVSDFKGTGLPLILEGGGHSRAFFLKAHMVLVSPGIPLDIPALKAVQDKGIPVFGEVEVFAAFPRPR